MRLIVDHTKCMKNAQCTYLHPELFARDDDDMPVPVVEQLDDSQLEAAREAVDLCMSSAIELVESDR
jgi:ferredoxin